MVSLDDAVIARLEKGGSRYEILVDPELVEKWKQNSDSIKISDLLAIEEIWIDAKNGDRPTSDSLENIFGTTNLDECVIKILKEGSIQLTTLQRKKIVAEKRKQIINNFMEQDPASLWSKRGKVFPYLVAKRCNELIKSVQEFI